MALKSKNKVSANFNMSSMTDIVFLLLIFFMITSTLVHPTALKMFLPQQKQSSVQKKAKVKLRIDKNINFFIDNKKVAVGNIESVLKSKLGDNKESYIALYFDNKVPVEDVVTVMNIAKNNDYKLVIASGI